MSIVGFVVEPEFTSSLTSKVTSWNDGCEASWSIVIVSTKVSPFALVNVNVRFLSEIRFVVPV